MLDTEQKAAFLLARRKRLIRKLNDLAMMLPLGLLERLVADAAFFNDWNRGKKAARKSRRMAFKYDKNRD